MTKTTTEQALIEMTKRWLDAEGRLLGEKGAVQDALRILRDDVVSRLPAMERETVFRLFGNVIGGL